MKKQKITFMDYLASRRREKESKRIEFTTEEMIRYKQLKEEYSYPIYLVVAPLYWIFYSTVFIAALSFIVRDYANAEIKLGLLKALAFVYYFSFKLWPVLIFVLFLSILIQEIRNSKRNRKLKEKIISERKYERRSKNGNYNS